jgi:hypothetical protein
MDACASCGAAAAPSACNGCHAVRYCDAACQRAHWKPAHKVACAGLKAEREQRERWAAQARRAMTLATTCAACTCIFSPQGNYCACAACQSEFYCSTSCQRAHWPAHKVECKGLAAAKFELIAESARAGDVHLQWALGQYYQAGTGVAVDDAASFQWYKRAADAGHIKAQACVGECYRFGRGVAQDHVVSFAWYERAAEAGDVLAAYNMGLIFFTGDGVAHDDAAAVKWFKVAAEGKHAGAQHALGRCFEAGRGVPRDVAAARTWYRRAADGGDAEALADWERLSAARHEWPWCGTQ